MIITKPARDLLSPARLDIVVKYMFFRSLRNGVMGDLAEGLYKRHIQQRTGGIEPDDFYGGESPKRSVDDYVSHAQGLFRSMIENGYDSTHPIPMGNNGLPHNGAHRMACALSLGMDVTVDTQEMAGIPWEHQWFIAYNYPKPLQSLILKEYAQLTLDRTIIFVLWGPALKFWDQIGVFIDQFCQTAGTLDFAFGEYENDAFRSFIYDMYAFGVEDQCDGLGNIDRKLGFLEDHAKFFRVVVASVPVERKDETFILARQIKDKLRESFSDHIQADKFITCHASESPGETLHLAATLLDPFNMEAIRKRRAAKPRPEFLRWLSAYGAKLAQAGISPEQCCVVGSSPLEVAGIRLSTDIDFTVKRVVREKIFNANAANIGHMVDIVSEGYHRVREGKAFTDDRLIDDPMLHFRFRGYKFANVGIVRERKDHDRRPKDVLDVELVDRYWQKYGK